MLTRISDEKIETWLKNRLGEGNRFEQFNRKFCQDLLRIQLEADQEKVQEIFKEIERIGFIRLRNSEEWQALKERMGVK